LTAPSVKEGLLAAMDSWGREVTPNELVDFWSVREIGERDSRSISKGQMLFRRGCSWPALCSRGSKKFEYIKECLLDDESNWKEVKKKTLYTLLINSAKLDNLIIWFKL
jgi:hypothetical protein